MARARKGRGGEGEREVRGNREREREFFIFPNPPTMIHDITVERKGSYLRSGKILDIR